MKKIISIIFLFIIFCSFYGCKVIMPPVQDARESNNYYYLPPAQKLTQPLSNIKKNFIGILFMGSGECRNLEITIWDSANSNNIILKKIIPYYNGNIRKTTYINFGKKIDANFKNPILSLNYETGQIVFGYKKNTKNNFYINDRIQSGELYYKSVYDISFFDVCEKIFIKIFQDKIFIIFYILFIIALAVLFFTKSDNFIFKIFFINKSIFSETNYSIIKKIILAGIILRVIVMPFFSQIDMISGLWVPYMMYYHNPVYYATDPEASFHLINQIFHFPIMMFSKYIFSDLFSLWEKIPFDYNISGVYNLSELKTCFRILFLNKITFLIADIICLVLLLNYFKKSKNIIKGLAFWSFNPIIIYVAYMIGRFDLYAIIFIIAGFLMFEYNKKNLGVLCFGIAAAFRQYPVLLFPFIIVIISKNFKEFIKYCIIIIAPLIIYNLLHNIPAYISNVSVKAPTAVVANDQHSNMLFHYQFSNLVLFPFFYFLLLFWTYKNLRLQPENLYKVVFCFFMILYSFANSEPQFFIWVIPVLAIVYIKEKVSTFELIIFFILFFANLLKWDKAYSTYLCLPLNPELFYYLPAPPRILNEFFPIQIINKLVTSCFTAFNVYWGLNILLKKDCD